MVSPLDDWRFLVGKWHGMSKGEFDEQDVIEGETLFSLEPSESFIMQVGEARSMGRLVNKSVSFMFYDSTEQKFKRKTFFSYGFVNNEVECERTRDQIKFDIMMEPMPKSFEGTRWRSFIRRISNDKVAMGLEVAREGEDFKRYGESILTRIR